jgi:hypothetical protein
VDRREPAICGSQHVLYMAGLVPDLSVGEPQRGQTCGRMSLIAQAVASLLGRRAVVREAVGLDDKAEIGPEEVDAEAVHVLLGKGRREPCSRDQPQESPLELGIGEDKGSTVEDVTQGCNAGLASVGVERGPEGLGIDKLSLVGLIDRSLHGIGLKHGRQIDQGANGARHRNAHVPRDLVGAKAGAAMEVDAGPSARGSGK